MITFTVALAAIGVFAAWAQNQEQAKKMRAAAPSGVKLQQLNIKPGLWETSISSNTAGEMPIPTEMLNRLTPEQRARMEERMKANSAAHGRTTTHKKCVTEEDLEQQKLDFAGDKECTPTVTASTSTMAKGKLSCQAEGMEGTAVFEVEAPDAEHYKGSSHGTFTGNGHTMNVASTFTGKWLGSSCGTER
jgi:hypothetical protein